MNGLGLDGQVDPVTGRFELLDGVGWTTSYEHWFNAHWLTNFTYSQATVGHAPNQPAGTYAGASYLAVSLWWIPVTNMSIGVEFLHGTRIDIDEEEGQARRIQTVFQYNF